MIGQTIHNYKIISLLGEGGMGIVYLAEHIKLGRKVAIKSLHAQFVKSEEIRARFINEAKMMAELQHANIVTLYDYVENENALYLIMELVDGKPIDDYIEQVSGPIEETSAILLMNEILEGFQYAHDKGLVHRDIKPSNLVIAAKNKVKILDFGIAKLVGDAGSKMTKTGTQIGTVFYMSPEQVKGDELDHRSDIYALGVTFFQMLTGNSPYKGMTKEFEVFIKIVNEDLPDPRTIYPGVSAHMCAIITKATARDVNERFQSCDEFAAALKDESIIALNDKQIDPSSEVFSANLIEPKEDDTKSVTDTNFGSTIPKHEKQERIGNFNLKNVSIAIGILFFIGILIFNFSKDGTTDKSVSTIPEDIGAKIDVPTETTEELVLKKAEPEPKQLPKATEKQKEVVKATPIVSSSKLKIGQKHQGGIIFYLDNSGEHGKVITERDFGDFDWDSAMKECQNLNLNGYSDWYLPTKNDLELLHNQHHVPPHIMSYYWSSTECVAYNNKCAFYFNFYFGSAYTCPKSNTAAFCGVRAF